MCFHSIANALPRERLRVMQLLSNSNTCIDYQATMCIIFLKDCVMARLNSVEKPVKKLGSLCKNREFPRELLILPPSKIDCWILYIWAVLGLNSLFYFLFGTHSFRVVINHSDETINSLSSLILYCMI